MTFEVDKDTSFIVVEVLEEHEDGSATFNLQIDDKSKTRLAGLGVELVVTCAAYGLDIDDALSYLRERFDTEEESESND